MMIESFFFSRKQFVIKSNFKSKAGAKFSTKQHQRRAPGSAEQAAYPLA